MSLALGACAPRIDMRGNAVRMDDVATITPGTHSRSNVLDKLGSPSSRSEFGVETWYYISKRTETVAFLAPKVVKRQVVVIKFDPHGIVSSVKTLDPKQAQKVVLAKGETPTAGNSLTFLEQFISNLGRFNKK